MQAHSAVIAVRVPQSLGMAVASECPEHVDDLRWRRILWIKQPFPDNYTSSQFLQKLQSEPSANLPTLGDLIVFSLPLSQQLGTTLAFVGLFLHLQEGSLTAESLASWSALGIILGAFSTGETANRTRGPSKPLAQPLSYALLGLVVLALSPLLKTLTEATTEDSIAALSAALFLLSFTLYDYSTPKAHTTQQNTFSQGPLPATLSLNASFCASIVLSSRLKSPIEVFALLLASIFLFAFLPRWARQHLPSRPEKPALPVLYTVLTTSTASALLLPYSATASILNILTALFLSLACPAWMRKAQSWKVGRRGPWDVGVPRIRPK